MKKTQHRGSDKKPGVLETRTAKTISAESSHGSVSDSRRSPVKAGGPHSYGWKDIWLTKSYFLYNLSLLISSTPHPQIGEQQWVRLRDSREATLQCVPKVPLSSALL